jgi:hypothetical protein
MIKVTPLNNTARPQTQTADAKIIKLATSSPKPTPQVLSEIKPPAPTSAEAAAMLSEPSTDVQSDNGEANSEAKPLSPQYAALARKEQALRTKEKEIQAKEAAIEDRIKSAVDEALNGYKSRLKEKTFEELNEIGLTYDSLVEMQLNGPAQIDPELKALKDEINALKASQTKQVEENTTRAQQQREAAIQQLTDDVQSLVSEGEEYSTVKEAEATKEVVDLIVKTFDETGKILKVEDAAKQIEDKLVKEAEKYLGFSKIKNKIPQLTPEAVSEAKATPTQQPIKTLTNSMTTTKQLSPRERAIMAATYGPNWRDKIK